MLKLLSLVILILPLSASPFEKMLDGLLTGSVQQVTPKELAQDLSKPHAITLLDTRPEKEYQVSHLKGAHCFGFKKADYSRLETLDRSTQIVTYCSVGKRSEKVGEKLLEMGFKNVRNLRGGIFQWANEKFPLVEKDDTPTNAVHPYNLIWGKWLHSHVEKRS